MSENVRPGYNLKPVQLKAIESLLICKTAQETAAAANINERTLRRWLQDTDFRSALFAAESALIDAATRRLLNAQSCAIDVLEDLLKAGNDSVRLRAALAVLDHTLRLRELRDIEQRIQAIELALQERDA